MYTVCCCLLCLCSGAGYVLADSVLSLRSVEKLFICDLNPVPVLQAVSQQSEHCSVSTLGIALEYHPELVRCVLLYNSMQQFTPIVNTPTHVYALCVQSCIIGIFHSASLVVSVRTKLMHVRHS